MAKIKTAAKPKRRRIEFTYVDKMAKQVFVTGDFNQWDQKSHPMKKSTDGTWKRSILLAPGRHEYKFFTDGNWREDNFNRQRCTNNFGTYNSIVDVS